MRINERLRVVKCGSARSLNYFDRAEERRVEG